ncbi:MAG TPA: hypothetical protein VG889_17680 [Rhizomicrobium sp.]|nr:hypothetical protein [Rhizomicrobium sp.]
MIFRAIFWVGLVALLMPHEPDLGFGRPASLDTGMTGAVADWAKENVSPSLKDPHNLCRFNTSACAAGATVLDRVRDGALTSLAKVKADIRANGRAHLRSGDGG